MIRLSSRLPPGLEPNALARAVSDARARGVALIDLTASNPTRAGFDYPADLLAPLADRSALDYEPQPLGLWPARAAVAEDYRRRGFALSADRVALTSSTSEAYALLFKLFCDAGHAVLAPRPSYPLVEHLARFESVSVVPYELDYHGAWRVDVDSVRRAPPEVRVLLVVSPNNPTGSFLHRDDLSALARLAAERGWPIIGDEVFADYPLDPAPGATSVLAQADVLACALGGLSKSAGLPQVKLGWIAFGGPAAAVHAALTAYEVVADAYLSVSTPVQVAAPWLLARAAAVRDQIRARIAANLAALRRLAAARPSVRVLTVEGGWSAVLQVPAVRSEEALVLELIQEDRVVVHPGYFFDFATEAFLVVSLLVEPSAFETGAARLLARAAREAGS